MATLHADEIERALATLPRWRFDADRRGLAAEFTFADFSGAFAFMTRVALLAEKRDHHPEWSNVWNRVHVLMTTHDAGGVTAADVEFARAIDGWGD